MPTIELKTAEATSLVKIEKGLLGQLGDLARHEHGKIVVITDTNLEKLYGDQLRSVLNDPLIIAVPAGEEQKNMDSVIHLASTMLEQGFGRKDLVIGFGGGMVTDLAGFVASIYMRGIRYIAMPTSLLAMVDAAIGGKTGANLGAKNMIGTTYLAEQVLIDSNLLKTLPEEEFTNGMGEVIKYAGGFDNTLFDDFENIEANLETILIKSAQAKVNVASADLKEGGLRKTLNYGHTFGHAIEAMSQYKYSHGQAISIGMVISNHIAQKLGKQEEKTGEKIKKTLEKHGLPTALPSEMTIVSLAELLMKDKKRSGDLIDFIIVPQLGKAEIISVKGTELIEMARDFS